MTLSRRFNLVTLARLLQFCSFFLLFLPSPSVAQAEVSPTGSSNCTAADLDVNLQFVNGPGDYYGIVLSKRNISSHPCIFDGPGYAPSFIPDHVEGDKPFGLCNDCENLLPNGEHAAVKPITVETDRVVWQTFRWKTAPPNKAVRCLQPTRMETPIELSAPLLIKKICSTIETSRFSITPPPAIVNSNRRSSGDRDTPELKLTSSKSSYFAGETFSLRVARSGRSTPALPTVGPSGNEVCPTLYLRERSRDGMTRIDEVGPLAFSGCPYRVSGHEPGDWKSGFDLESGANWRWSGLGEHSMKLYQLAGSMDEPKVHLASSNLLRIQMVDPATIIRKWGSIVKSVAADVRLDKDIYQLGEDVPLHLAIENFDATGTIYSLNTQLNPCFVIRIEVQDPDGSPLLPDRRFLNFSECEGSAMRGWMRVPKGTAFPLERSLGDLGWLPSQPGTYNVVVSWATRSGPEKLSRFDQELEPYATARATATIRVVGTDASTSRNLAPRD